MGPLVRILVAMRGIRGIGQGLMLANLALCLRKIGWSGTDIGLLLALGTLGEMGAVVAVGLLSGKYQRARRLLFAGEILTFAGALTGLFTGLFSLSTGGFWAASILGGFGQRSNGSPGPFVPAEQSLLSRSLSPSDWSRSFSILMSSGFLGMGAGALLSAVPDVFVQTPASGSVSIAWIYGISASLSLASLILLAHIMKYQLPPDPGLDPSISEKDALAGERSRIGLLVLINLMGGLAIGLSDLMIPYWFSVRYHIGTPQIAPLMAGVFFLTGIASLFGARLVRFSNEVPLFLGTQAGSVVLLLLFPWVPSVQADFLLLALRFILARAPVGIRQAFVNRLVRGHRIGLASSLNIVSLQGGQLVGPILAGFMIDRSLGWTPFLLAGLLQAGGIWLSKILFSRKNPPNEGTA
jgi:MFS family permease